MSMVLKGVLNHLIARGVTALLLLSASLAIPAAATEHVGAVAGHFDVSPTGEAIYEIPIYTPPASGGMQPSLSLYYQHRGGRGIAGQGWTVGGLSSISRCGQTIAQDGQIRGVRFDSGDKLCLDGQRLVVISGTYGAAGSQYRTEIESFQKIVAHGTQGTGPQYFTVTQRDGTVRRYGHYHQSSLSTVTSTYENWALNQIEDLHGNKIVIDYTANGTTGELLLDDITYNENTAQGLTHRYRVEFDYEPRPATDNRSGYTFGEIWSSLQRLQKIRVETRANPGGVWQSVYDYTLAYQIGVSGRSQLLSVQQCRGTDCLRASEFDWLDAVVGWNSAVSSGNSSSGHTYPKAGDFNGDGQKDLFVVSGGEWHVLTAASGSFGTVVDTNKVATNASNAMTLDFNGDGKTDILFRGTDSEWHVYVSDGTAFTEIDTGESSTTLAYAQDMDGDGLDDVLYSSGGSVYYRRSIGTDFETTQRLILSTSAISIAPYGRRVTSPTNLVDFDGDGRGDIVLKETFPGGGGGPRGGGGGPIINWTAYEFDGTGLVPLTTLSISSQPFITDINGDGLHDITYFDSGSLSYVTKISTGKGVATGTSAINDYSNWDHAVFADYDGDGREDLIRATTSNWIVHLSDGDSYETSGTSIGGPTPLTSAAIPMDVSGSGHEELVMSNGGYWKVRGHKSAEVDIVSRFEDGLGNYFEPSHEPISTSARYTQYYFGSPPDDKSYQEPLYVVTSLTGNDGDGGSYTHAYYYWGAKMNLKGRGFLGFRQIRRYDYREGLRIFRDLYRQDFPFVGRLEWQQILDSSWDVIRWTDPAWYQSQTYSGAYFVRAESTTVRDFEVAGALKGSETKKTVDDPTFETTYGNVTQRAITTTSPHAAGDSYMTRFLYQYQNLTGPWCLGLPTQTKIERSATGAQTKTRTVNATFDLSTCQLLTTTDVSESSQDLQLKSTLTYDGYGNIKTRTLDSANGAAADRKTEYFYDQWGNHVDRIVSYVDGATNPEVNYSWDYKNAVPESLENAQGQTTTWEYDAFGRLEKETRPDGTTTVTDYVDCLDCWIPGKGRVRIDRTDSSGFVSTELLDRYGRRLALQDRLPKGTSSRYTLLYDTRGRLLWSSVPQVYGETTYWTEYTYDNADRLVEIDRPVSESVTTGSISAINYQGLTQTTTNPEGQTATTEYDPLGRVVKVTDSLLGETEYEYTVFDELHKAWDPANNLTTINYNTRGDKTSSTEPNMGAWSYTYTVFGEPKTITDAKSQVATFNYNQLGLPTSRVETEGTTTWSYFTSNDHKLWLPSGVTAPYTVSETYSYDTLSRLASVVATQDGTSYATDYSYHASGSGKGRLQRITYPTSTSGFRFKVDYDYDAWGYLDKVKNGDSPSTVYFELSETDGIGRQRLAILGNGLDEDRVYDRANGYLTTIKTGPNLTATVQNLSYQWDKIGNLTQRQDINQSKTEDFTYDGLNRIKTAKLNSSLTLSVDYNSIGNITYKSDVGTYTYGAGAAGPNTVTSITGTRPGTYSYDANGNMTTRAGDAITVFSFNRPNKINYGSDYAAFRYGAARELVKQVAKTGSSTTTTYYIGGHFEKETTGSSTEYRHNILANGRTVAIYTRPTSGSVTTRYVHRDHMGSVVALSNETGTVTEQLSFDAFGKRRNTDWSADTADLRFLDTHTTENGYTGHEHLDNTRLVHMRGRVQDPIIGRMTSADPFVPNPLNTQSFNRYSYVVNRPLSLIDPSGFTDEPIDEIVVTGRRHQRQRQSAAFHFRNAIRVASYLNFQEQDYSRPENLRDTLGNLQDPCANDRQCQRDFGHAGYHSLVDRELLRPVFQEFIARDGRATDAHFMDVPAQNMLNAEQMQLNWQVNALLGNPNNGTSINDLDPSLDVQVWGSVIALTVGPYAIAEVGIAVGGTATFQNLAALSQQSRYEFLLLAMRFVNTNVAGGSGFAYTNAHLTTRGAAWMYSKEIPSNAARVTRLLR